MFSKIKLAVVIGLVLFASMGLLAQDPSEGKVIDRPYLTIDCAVNGLTFQAANGAFVIEGYLYPAGTLDATNGINVADGSPEFPDLVLGLWTCRGWGIFPRTFLPDPGGAVTTQGFEFDLQDAGNDMIITVGHEPANVPQDTTRAVVGGTGIFSSSKGEQIQDILGLNTTQGPNYRSVFTEKIRINFKK